MEIEIVEFKIQPDQRRLAWVLIQYGNLFLNCDLVYHIKDQKLWIRMPEIWKDDKKIRSCFWPNKAISDNFQKETLEKIYKNYDFSLEKVLKEKKNYKMIDKNDRKNLKCKRKARLTTGLQKGQSIKKP